MNNKDYLRQQLEWVERRLEALEIIEAKLAEMKALAEFARDNNLNPVQIQEITHKLQILQKEVTELDEQSRGFRLDCH